MLSISALDSFIPSFLRFALNDLLSSATIVSNPILLPSVSANLIVFLTLLSPIAVSIASASAIFAFCSAVLGPLFLYLSVISFISASISAKLVFSVLVFAPTYCNLSFSNVNNRALSPASVIPAFLNLASMLIFNFFASTTAFKFGSFITSISAPIISTGFAVERKSNTSFFFLASPFTL